MAVPSPPPIGDKITTPVLLVSIRNGRQSFQTPELAKKTAIRNRGFIRQEGRSYQAR